MGVASFHSLVVRNRLFGDSLGVLRASCCGGLEPMVAPLPSAPSAVISVPIPTPATSRAAPSTAQALVMRWFGKPTSVRKGYGVDNPNNILKRQDDKDKL